jgi:hypothetical protein
MPTYHIVPNFYKTGMLSSHDEEARKKQGLSLHQSMYKCDIEE